MSLKVFSIEEFSIYDGPGIRTTIFFSGCPLNCNWCHSPEGRLFNKVTLKNPNGCLRCNKCVDICPTKRKSCIGCEKCIDVCPLNLIRISYKEYTVNELTSLILKNVKLLNLNEGGVTLSGGEPLSQNHDLIELIYTLNKFTHVAIQTSGYGNKELFKEVINNVNLVLFDMKIMDKEKAKFYEGIDNSLIFENFEILKSSNTPFIIRIPLIPRVIDTKENLEKIILKIKDSKNLLGVELLPYNKYAGSKYALINKKYEPLFDESIESNPYLDLFEKYNIKVRIL